MSANEDNKVLITITGNPKTGKSATYTAIAKALSDSGFAVEHADSEFSSYQEGSEKTDNPVKLAVVLVEMVSAR